MACQSTTQSILAASGPQGNANLGMDTADRNDSKIQKTERINLQDLRMKIQS